MIVLSHFTTSYVDSSVSVGLTKQNSCYYESLNSFFSISDSNLLSGGCSFSSLMDNFIKNENIYRLFDSLDCVILVSVTDDYNPTYSHLIAYLQDKYKLSCDFIDCCPGSEFQLINNIRLCRHLLMDGVYDRVAVVFLEQPCLPVASGSFLCKPCTPGVSFFLASVTDSFYYNYACNAYRFLSIEIYQSLTNLLDSMGDNMRLSNYIGATYFFLYSDIDFVSDVFIKQCHFVPIDFGVSNLIALLQYLSNLSLSSNVTQRIVVIAFDRLTVEYVFLDVELPAVLPTGI